MRWMAIAIVALWTGRADARGPEELARAFAAHYVERYGEAELIEDAPPACPEGASVRASALREGLGPVLIAAPETPASDAIVLIHGLSDSPYYLCAIASSFHQAGAAIVLPLLTGHGRIDPLPELHARKLRERWREDVEHAVWIASQLGERVSIGGLSLGGLLAVDAASRHPGSITGGLYLFSAALKLPAIAQWIGLAAEWGLEAPIGWALRRFETDRRNDHPNRWRDWFSNYGALHVELLSRETRARLERQPLAQRVFYGHSVDDPTALVSGPRALTAAAPDRVTAFEIDVEDDANCKIYRSGRCAERLAEPATNCPVAHASAPLAEPLRLEDGSVCEPANPAFDRMIATALDHFHSLGGEAERR